MSVNQVAGKISPKLILRKEVVTEDQALVSQGLTTDDAGGRDSKLRSNLKLGQTVNLEGVLDLPQLKLKLTNFNVSLFARKGHHQRKKPSNDNIKIMRDM